MGVIYTAKDSKFVKEHEINRMPWEVWRLYCHQDPGSPRRQAGKQPVSDSLT